MASKMKIESTSFTAAELEGFATALEERDRVALAERLESASARLEALGARLRSTAGGDGESWSGHEVLGHIAVLSQFYGYLTHQIGTGKLAELDLLSMVKLRDVRGAEMAARPAAELLAGALADQRQTAAYLRSATAADLRRPCAMGARQWSAFDIARLPLCSHLELHLDQLEKALGSGRG